MANSLPNQGSYEWTSKLTESSSAIRVLESFSPSMRSVESVIRELARSDAPILLLGEPGAGEHATARRIHEMSGRSESPLRSFRASTVTPEDLNAAHGSGSVACNAESIF